jgi:hypothetical protein
MATRQSTPRIKEFPNDGQTWRVDWIGSVERNYQVPSEPTIQIIVSPLIEGTTEDAASNKAIDHERRTTIAVGVGQLPLIAVGSLWKNRRWLGTFAGKSKTFANLEISPQTVRLVKADTSIEGDQLIRRRYHRIGSGLGSYCLAVEWQGDPYGIIIPASEIIRFYYATSSDLTKAIFAGDFRHNLNRIVNTNETGFDASARRFYVKLRKEFADADAWVIGRILCCEKAFAGAALVHDSMIKASVQNKARIFPEAAFPFTGKTTLRANVKSMKAPDETRWRYIVFSLEHCTALFPFDSILCHRDNSNIAADEETDLPDIEKDQAFPTPKPPVKAPDGELQSEDEPSKNVQGAVVLLPGDRFGAITGLELEKPEKEMCHYISGHHIKLPEHITDEFGTGDGTYADNDIAPTDIISDPVRESTRQAALPSSFKTFKAVVEYLNRQSGMQATIRPATEKTAYIPTTKAKRYAQWSYLDSQTKERRIVAIADIVSAGKKYSLVEFQHRESESFRLAIVSLSDSAYINDELMHKLLLALAIREGRWENINPLPPKIVLATLKHTWASVEACSNVIIAKIS